MRKAVVILATLLVFASCKKEDALKQFGQRLNGTWELRQSFGLAGFIYPPGNGNLLLLKENGGYQFKKHDSLLATGTYSLSIKTDCSPRPDNTLMQTSDGASYYVDVKDTLLTLSSSNCLADGGGGIYRRIP